LTFEQIAAIPEDAPLNCADAAAQQQMMELIDQKKAAGDTLGGIFEVVARASRRDWVRTPPGTRNWMDV
jgi:chorismate synthase